MISLIVALLLFAAVGIPTYNSLVVRDDRIRDSRNADCRRTAEVSIQASPYGDPDAYAKTQRDCERRAHETTMAERSIPHYIFGAWVWGILAGLLGGLLTFFIVGRRQRAGATDGGA